MPISIEVFCWHSTPQRWIEEFPVQIGFHVAQTNWVSIDIVNWQQIVQYIDWCHLSTIFSCQLNQFDCITEWDWWKSKWLVVRIQWKQAHFADWTRWNVDVVEACGLVDGFYRMLIGRTCFCRRWKPRNITKRHFLLLKFWYFPLKPLWMREHQEYFESLRNSRQSLAHCFICRRLQEAWQMILKEISIRSGWFYCIQACCQQNNLRQLQCM